MNNEERQFVHDLFYYFKSTYRLLEFIALILSINTIILLVIAYKLW